MSNEQNNSQHRHVHEALQVSYTRCHRCLKRITLRGNSAYSLSSAPHSCRQEESQQQYRTPAPSAICSTKLDAWSSKGCHLKYQRNRSSSINPCRVCI